MKLQNGNKEHVELTLATYATTQVPNGPNYW